MAVVTLLASPTATMSEKAKGLKDGIQIAVHTGHLLWR